MRELTSRQREVLDFMRGFQARHGVPPTVREIGERFRITPRASFDHLRALERKGQLQRRPSVGRTSRALTLPDVVGAGRAYHSVPILGRIAAGAPPPPPEKREGEVTLAAPPLPRRGADGLPPPVPGGLLVDAHIFHGGLLVVRPPGSAQPTD